MARHAIVNKVITQPVSMRCSEIPNRSLELGHDLAQSATATTSLELTDQH